VVRRALLAYGIAQPQEVNPFQQHQLQGNIPDLYEEIGAEEQGDDVIDPSVDVGAIPLPPDSVPRQGTASYSGPLSSISDHDLDNLVLRLRSHFRRAGVSMMTGFLRRLGYQIQRERIRESLARIDPVQRVFQRITIRRRTYSVPGPNALWHHDGQHGLSFPVQNQCLMNNWWHRIDPVENCNPWFH
jgi:hypothetical protein